MYMLRVSPEVSMSTYVTQYVHKINGGALVPSQAKLCTLICTYVRMNFPPLFSVNTHFNFYIIHPYLRTYLPTCVSPLPHISHPLPHPLPTVTPTHTCTALPRFPLSKRDSNKSVVSSIDLEVELLTERLGPARETVNYNVMNDPVIH